MNSNLIAIIIGALIAILGATGLITADEGTSLTTYGTQAATGILGVVEVIRAIVARRKGKPQIAGGDNASASAVAREG